MKGKNIKVAMIEPVGGHGGNEFYDFGLCEYLCYEDVGVTLYTTDETSLDTKHKFAFQTKKPFKKIFGDAPKLIRGLRYLWGTLNSIVDAKRSGAMIAHFHIYHFSTVELMNILLARLIGLACVSTVHDVQSFETNNDKARISVLNRLGILLNKRLIVHSDLAYEELRYIGADQEKIKQVPHRDTDFLYSQDRVDQATARKTIGFKDDAIMLLFFGQIKRVKGLDILLSAIPYMDKRVHVMVVGKCWKQELSTYLELLDSENIKDRVTFVNSFIPNEMVPFYFWASDIVCLPYKKIYQSGVVLRALDYGSTIIASDLPPLKAMISDGETGLLFRSEDPIDLASKVNELATDKLKRDRLAKNAKAFVDHHYGWPIIAEATKAVYEEILPKPS